MKDSDLFNQEFADIKPIDNSDKVQLSVKKRHIETLKHRRDAAQHSPTQDNNYLTDAYVDNDSIEMLKPHDWLEYKKAGVQEGVYRKLRLGKYPIDATLDLHRLSIKQARLQVWKFIEESIRDNYRTVIITHGKGEQGNPPAKMKSYTAYWLKQLKPVMAFHTTQPQHGSYGAVYVLLQKSEKQKQKTREFFKGK